MASYSYLRNQDIFIVNRPGAAQETYKAYMEDIGWYLFEVTFPDPDNKPDGGDGVKHWINDGLLNVSDGTNTKQYSSTNNFENLTLTFSPGFIVGGIDKAPNVQHDMLWMANELTICNNNITNEGACLVVDKIVLGDQMTECEGGIDSNNGCLVINFCEHSGLAQDAGGCVKVLLCADSGIIQSSDLPGGGDGCLMLDIVTSLILYHQIFVRF